MAEDLLDYWVKLITTVFPENAWISSRYFNEDCLIQIDWKLGNDPKNPNKRSQKIEIIIKESVIDNYLDKSKTDRELSDTILKDFICERYHDFISDHDIQASQYASTKKWLISRDMLNYKSSEAPLSDYVKSGYQ
jgi:hypothetical protein